MEDPKIAFPKTIQGCFVVGSCLTSGHENPDAIGCLFIINDDSIFMIRHNEDAFSLINCRKIISDSKKAGTILVMCEDLTCSDTDLAGFSIKITDIAEAARVNRLDIECIQLELRGSEKRNPQNQNLSDEVSRLHRLENKDAVRRIENAISIGTTKTAYSAKNSIWLAKYLREISAIEEEAPLEHIK